MGCGDRLNNRPSAKARWGVGIALGFFDLRPLLIVARTQIRGHQLGSGATPVGRQERADRNGDHMVDTLVGGRFAGIEEKRL
jgi:hypothetical protein